MIACYHSNTLVKLHKLLFVKKEEETSNNLNAYRVHVEKTKKSWYKRYYIIKLLCIIKSSKANSIVICAKENYLEL